MNHDHILVKILFIIFTQITTVTGSKINRVIQIGSKELGILAVISLGVFLFVLFFQPFPFEYRDFNDSLLFIAGLGGIVFLILWITRIIFSFPWNSRQDQNPDDLMPSYLHGFLILVLCSVAFLFYLRYVGKIPVTFYNAFKVVLICFVPPLVLRLYYTYKRLAIQSKILEYERESLQAQIESYRENNLNKRIEFITDNIRENLMLLPRDIVCIRSADNYVEIIHKEEELFKKKLIRNTLRNVEQMLKPWSVFIRCHRTCIVNILHVQNLYKKYNNHHIKIKGYDEEIPVSRQYLFRLKEALDKGQGQIKFAPAD